MIPTLQVDIGELYDPVSKQTANFKTCLLLPTVTDRHNHKDEVDEACKRTDELMWKIGLVQDKKVH
jgi:hypothetical protein